MRRTTDTSARRRISGFTLIEVLVALVILGLGMASILVAYSSSLNLMRVSRDKTTAALLARSKLEETIATNNADIEGDSDEERYNGVLYAYRITTTPLPLVSKTVADHFKDLPQLEEIRVDVYWGEKDKQQNYELVSYRRRTPANTAVNTTANTGSQTTNASPFGPAPSPSATPSPGNL
ncbi:MAG: prepilin-type N-terminal cleavage/methylation domain-containing protein [Burkholderiales bacterium]|nr:prepilin-type N-terminal cleavage/methylation domain-containing protein [Burkholderiales bacterium]